MAIFEDGHSTNYREEIQVTCRLCQEEKTLKNSHIIPELAFKPAYDENSRAIELTLIPSKKKKLQKGYREYLLCGDCEQHIGKYEKYFNDTWYQRGKCPEYPVDPHTKIDCLDYAKFKLLHLSILWKASIASIEMFRQVKLGPHHEEKLRTMILDNDPGPPTSYGLFVIFLKNKEDGSVSHQIIMEPGPIDRIEGHRVYVFTFAGCAWYYLVSSHKQPSYFTQSLSEDGVLLATAQNWEEFGPMQSFHRRLHGLRPGSVVD